MNAKALEIKALCLMASFLEFAGFTPLVLASRARAMESCPPDDLSLDVDAALAIAECAKAQAKLLERGGLYDDASGMKRTAVAAYHAAQAVNQERVSAKPGKAESERYAFRCWMVRMGLVGDEYRPMRRRFLKRLPGDSETKAPRVSRENIENLTPLR